MRSLAWLAPILLLAASASAQSRTALLLGSSSVLGHVGLEVVRGLEEEGLEVQRRARSASGFARPDYFDWEAELPALEPVDRHALVLVYAGGNDAQALRLRPAERRNDEAGRDWIRWSEEARWREVYANRVKHFINELCARGAPRVVMLLPADGGREGWTRRIGRVREAQADGAHQSRCGVPVDAGVARFESVDGVHLSRRGAARWWSSVGPLLHRLLSAPR